MKVLITGAGGFVGKNLMVALKRQEGLELLPIEIDSSREERIASIKEADFIFHLAGVNRPIDPAEFALGNHQLSREMVDCLLESDKRIPVVYTSSIQAKNENPYGISKRNAEKELERYAEAGGRAMIYRLPNLFGKWCRPNYNSAVSTFCHNIARNLDITVTDRSNVVNLVYIDDVVRAFIRILEDPEDAGEIYRSVDPVFTITLGDLVDRIYAIKETRDSLLIPDLTDPLNRYLYSTFISYLKQDEFSYDLHMQHDDRGVLFEFIKSGHFGQIFLSRTKPGITRGNHFHDTKVEKFCVIQGDAIIRFRKIDSDEILDYPVNGDQVQVVDIPPGYTHNITNVGDTEMIVAFWANEIFDKSNPDTHFLKV